jgi:hypothetical protein
MANKIIHKHSSVTVSGKAKLPTAEQLDYGELAVNYATGVETISLKNDDDDIITIESQPTYKTNMPSGLTMVNAVGGISSGTKVSDLSGKTITSILDDLLFPTLIPTTAKTEYNAPGVSGFVLSPNTTPVKINTSVPTISNASLNRGNWKKYDSTVKYAGEATSTIFEITINGTKMTGSTLTSITNATSYPSTFTTAGNQTFKVTINYGQGPAPKDSKGNPVNSLAAPASSVTATRTVNVTYPWSASTVEAGTLTEQALIGWNTTAGTMVSAQITLVGQDANVADNLKQSFALPRQVTKVETLNTLSNQWEETTSSWEQNGTITSNERTYYKYNLKTDASNGAQIVKITF